MRTLDGSQARRLALAAQGLEGGRPAGRVDVRHLRRVLDTTNVVQLDSVNVTVRAHYMPSFSRLGAYDRGRLDDLLWRDREAFEYVGHAASVMPMRLHPLMRFRMADARPWSDVDRLRTEHPGYIEQVHAQVVDDGPLSVADLEDAGSRTGSWWGWNRGRVAVEWLHRSGRLAVAERDDRFQLRYDLVERVIPGDVLAMADIPRDAAGRELLLLAARAHGVGTASDLADYWRLPIRTARVALGELVDAGDLELVAVEGWSKPAYVHPQTRLPRRVSGRALLSPFDPLVWSRERAERLFGFRYRIEIYVPADRRQYGYYVLPFLLDGSIVARVDLKSDRDVGVLRVLGSYAESDVDVVRVARELVEELRLFADWQDLHGVSVASRGDLAAALAREL